MQKALLFKNLLIALFCCNYVFAFNAEKVDSLKLVLNSSVDDSLKINALNYWDELIYESNPILSYQLNCDITDLCRKNLNYNLSDHSFSFYQRKLAESLNNIGIFYTDIANYRKAIEFYKKAVVVNKKNKFEFGLAKNYNNIAWIYYNQLNYTKALNYYTKVLKIFEEIQDNYSISMALKNIGAVYIKMEDYTMASKYCNRSLAISKDYDLGPLVLEDIGFIYFKQGNYSEAINAYETIYDYFLKEPNTIGLSFVSEKMGILFREKGDLKKAIKYYKRAIHYKNEVNSFDGADRCAKNLFEIYKSLGDVSNALKYHELYLSVKDSLSAMNAKEDIFRFDVEQEYALKKQADSLHFENEMTLQKTQSKAKSEKSKILRNYLIGVLLLILSSLILLFVHYRKTRNQKEVIETKQKEISDSISYAKRIQDALMTSSLYLKEVLPDSFIFFKPKDVVSGDFYWVHKNNKEEIFFTVADCTGHGVPGAFMSMIGTSLLNENIIENRQDDTAEILNNMKKQIIKALKQDVNDSKDGMDLALCKFHPKKGLVQFSGAYNPLIHISNEKVNYIKGDKQPIAYYAQKDASFTSNTIKVQKGDMLYIFSDGFIDQFGGEKGKKYMTGKFKKFLFSISKMSIKEQEHLVKNEFSNWKGENEQLDDVCVMGVRV